MRIPKRLTDDFELALDSGMQQFDGNADWLCFVYPAPV
jgi:hypothetical protein